MNKLTLLASFAVAIPSALAVPPCYWCGTRTVFSTEWEVTVDVTTACPKVSGSALVASFAWTWDIEHEPTSSPCCAGCDNVNSDLLVDSDSGNPCSSTLSSSMSTTAIGCNEVVCATGSASATLTGLDRHQIANSELRNEDYSMSYAAQMGGGCDSCGPAYKFCAVNGFNIIAANYVFGTPCSGSTTIDKTYSYHTSVATTTGFDCLEDPCGGSFLTAELLSVEFFTDAYEATYSGSGPQQSVTQGLLARYSDASQVRWGLLTDSGLSGGGGTVTRQTTFSNTNLLGLRTESRNDLFTEFDGDINGDLVFSHSDRVAFASAYGTNFGDWNYNPRADFNLDGDVDAADLVAYNTLRCPADTDDGLGTGNWDGAVTIDDLLYFLDVFGAGTPQADLDDGTGIGLPDGGVTVDDYLFFLDRFGDGC